MKVSLSAAAVLGAMLVIPAVASPETVPSVPVHVYGPGGPAPAMSECARTFNARNSSNVVVTFGPTKKWRDAAAKDADMFYSGAENMMTGFVGEFATQIDETTVVPLYVRAATILVHRGNPLGITGLGDLQKRGVRVMVVQGSGQTGLWEDLAGRVGDVSTIAALRRNITVFAPDTATAHGIWNSAQAPDAWIALMSEHGAHPDESMAIALDPKVVIVRDAGLLLTRAGEARPVTRAFYDFVRSADCAAIFKRFGWTS